jgi:hypothetical protein
MEKEPIQQTHYGALVWVNPTTEELRKTECLCLNCSNMKFGDANCPIAKALYTICINSDVALAVTRCPLWTPKP